MKEKIIFLDCDGVLNRIAAGDMRYFTPECFQYFRDIVLRTGAKIVLSTSWREFTDWESMLKDFFGAIGISIIGKTPIIDTDHRPQEIQSYLDAHGEEISNYVVLDDIDMRAEFPGHCVCTCAPGRLGLDQAWTNEAILILENYT